MIVKELWRYPVKSMQGEQIDSAEVGRAGLDGDRRFAIVDRATGLGLTGRRAPELLMASARLVGNEVEITLPDGSRAADDAALSSWLGRDVELVDAYALDGGKTFECPSDLGTEQDWFEFTSAGTAFHDADIWRVSIISTGTIGEWDRRRFRMNVLVDSEGENNLAGAEITLGDTHLRVTGPILRCVMVTRPQPGGIERDLEVLKTINRDHGSCLAVGATVATPGTIRVGDPLVRL
ncbi:MAG TPA: MOSC N-terminal beta barrel domain-containing protein [Acidimicrobiia bacterium]|jgi:uncharacterized protein YcbX|nr:MOSC N-terminal beta barrel domain-containing protein [Acidimicrobiia bacterium]